MSTELNYPLPVKATIVTDQAVITQITQWLGNQPIWHNLPPLILEAIANSLSCFEVTPDTGIYEEGHTPKGLYILKSGMVEIFKLSPLGKLFVKHCHDGDLFGYTLGGDLDQAFYHSSAIAVNNCEILFLPQAKLTELIKIYPLIQNSIHGMVCRELNHFSNRIAWEEERLRGLHSYIQTIPIGEKILGNSKATQKLIQQIKIAVSSLKPVIFQAQPGTGKTFLAGLIHSQSKLADQPFAELDCTTLPRHSDGRINTDLLFGRSDQKAGILELLESGTLLLDNVQILSEADLLRLSHYFKTGLVLSNHGIEGHKLAMKAPFPVRSSVRLILSSPQKLSLNDEDVMTIKLFNLAQRKGDIAELSSYFLNKFCQEKNRRALSLDQADLRRLISYEYPGNIAELKEILHRAIMMTPPNESLIPEQALWSVQSSKNAFRLDLLSHVPGLRQFLLSKWYPEGIWYIMMAIFVPVIILGFVGEQSRGNSITLNLFWAWWWSCYLFLFVFLGRIWCAVCPFMITGEWVRRLSLKLFPRQQLSWNNKWLNRWGAWLLFAGFLIIYLWEKLWDLPHHAYLSSWLLIAITLGAVIFSLIYERRLWCRHLCPIGGMNGMFAKLAMTELRSSQQVCATQCNTFGCYQGSTHKPLNFDDLLPNEGQVTDGCPLYSHPAQLQDNRDCMLCMTCVKTCPNRSGQLNLRFPASDLFDNDHGFWAEATLLLLLFGGVFMHHSHKILNWLGFPNVAIDSDHLLTSLPITLLLLTIPAIFIFLTHGIARFFDQKQPNYLTIIYAYLPFVLAANLADYVPSFMMEAGQFLPVLARTFGGSGEGLPSLTWSLDVAQFLQGVTLISAMVFSPYPLLRITKREEDETLTTRVLSNFPHLLLMTGFTIFLCNLLI